MAAQGTIRRILSGMLELLYAISRYCSPILADMALGVTRPAPEVY